MTQLATQNPVTAKLMESVLLGGDLSKLDPKQRVSYYRSVCESVGLNPLTKPFEYIKLNNKLTLYAKKDATDQLRSINGVSIERPEITFKDGLIIVTISGHDKNGRKDSDVGVVVETPKDKANAIMKAVTKAKRRLTLSLCGLGWLDETEVETIPTAEPVVFTETGTIEKEPEPTNGNRPYPPHILKAKIEERSQVHATKLAPDINRNILGKMLKTTFENDDTKRYEFSKWLFTESSVKKIPDAYIWAAFDWLGVSGTDFNEVPNEHALAEVKQALPIALKAQGQAELL